MLQENTLGNEVEGEGSPESRASKKTVDAKIFFGDLKWGNIILLLALHLVSLYSVVAYFREAKLITMLWSILIAVFSGFGVSNEAHSLLSNKGKLPLKLGLLTCHSMAGQGSLYDWARDCRIQSIRKYSKLSSKKVKEESFFAHLGRLLYEKRNDVKEIVDMSDISKDDALLEFYMKNNGIINIVCCMLPMTIPALVWGENWIISILFVVCVRYVLTLYITGFMNSATNNGGYKSIAEEVQRLINIFGEVLLSACFPGGLEELSTE